MVDEDVVLAIISLDEPVAAFHLPPLDRTEHAGAVVHGVCALTSLEALCRSPAGSCTTSSRGVFVTITGIASAIVIIATASVSTAIAKVIVLVVMDCVT